MLSKVVTVLFAFTMSAVAASVPFGAMGREMYDRGEGLVWMADALMELLAVEDKADMLEAMVDVAGELLSMEGALSRQASGGELIFSMEVVCMGRALDDFVKHPAWDGLPFPEGDGGDVLREEVAVAFRGAELLLSLWYDANVCGVEPLLLRRGGFTPVDSLAEFQV